MTNIFQCTYCNTQVIAEELTIHQCKQILERKIEGDILWLKDDKHWYPIKRRQPQKARSDGFFHKEHSDGDFPAPT